MFTATFTWLDGSERQRRQMKDILSQFKEQGTRDELGLSVIRDAFADLLFPGTGALQTRARYFLFVPWMYQDFERKRVPASEVSRRGRQFEVRLIDYLVDNVRETGEAGVIGRRARRNLQRLPSNIYWGGLRRLGILQFHGTQEQFHHRFDRLYTGNRSARNDDGDLVTDSRFGFSSVPAAPEGFPEKADFNLTRAEATYLCERVQQSAPKTFFAWWLDRDMPGIDAAFAWEAAGDGDVPAHLARQLRHAHCFSLTMQGATVLYSQLLTGLRKDAESAARLADLFDEWHGRFIAQRSLLAAWEFPDFWQCVMEGEARVGSQTRDFVQNWFTLAMTAGSAEALRTSQASRDLLDTREWQLKKGLARFRNPRALELWGGASGLGAMDFRWMSAVTLGQDIAKGLARS